MRESVLGRCWNGDWYCADRVLMRVRYLKSDMIKSLSDHIIDETCARFGNIPDGCSKSRPHSKPSVASLPTAAPRACPPFISSILQNNKN